MSVSTRMRVALARRSLCALALTPWWPPLPASAIFSSSMQPAKYYGTASGLIYFDEPLGADPPPPASYVRLWIDPQDNVSDVSDAPVLRRPGSAAIIDYRVRRGGFNGEIVALSDGPGNGGSVRFIVGDRTVNPAVDELVRSLPAGVTRRAVVPAKFDLDRGTRASYPREEPPGTTYIELSLRKLSASNSVGVCPGSDAESTALASTCLCNTGRTEAYGIFEMDLDSAPGGRPASRP